MKDRVLTLVGPAEVSVIQVPYEPGPEYNLHLTVERLGGTNYFAVGLVVGGRPCSVLFDGWPDQGRMTGLQLVNGRYAIDNGTATTGQQLPPRKAIHLDVAVRRGSINAWVYRPGEDPLEVLKYTGPQDGLGIETDFIKGMRNSNALFLHQHGTAKFEITAVALNPVGRDAGNSPPPARQPESLNESGWPPGSALQVRKGYGRRAVATQTRPAVVSSRPGLRVVRNTARAI